MSKERTEPRISDFARAHYIELGNALITEAHASSGDPKTRQLFAGELGLVYDWTTYQVGVAAIPTIERAIEWWLRAPVRGPKPWKAYTHNDFPETPVGMLLLAADARLRLEQRPGLAVHQSAIAALAGISVRRVRVFIDNGELENLEGMGKIREWITPQSARAWLKARGKA